MTQNGNTKSLDLGAMIHAVAGLIALVAGGLMYQSTVMLYVFAGLMVLSALSSVVISWQHHAWVTGHWLAMIPIIGVIIGFSVDVRGFTLAYITLWIAFIHFVYRGIQHSRNATTNTPE